MTTLNDFNYVDDSDDVMAEHVNNLVAASFRSEYKNAETLSATRTLLDVDTPFQRFNCNGANRIVKMPTANSVENHPYLIVNSTASGTYTLTVQNNGGTATLISLNPSEFAFLMPDGNGGYFVITNPFSLVLSPSQITANQNNYNPSGAGSASVLRIDTDASREITGFGFPVAYKTILVVNAGSNPSVFKNESASSTAENRFAFGADLTLATQQAVMMWYDPTSSRWRLVGGAGSSGASSTKVQLSSASPRVYTANDTWSKPTGLVYVEVEVIGGGGAGGGAGATSGSEYACGSGGGGGGYSKKKILAASLGSSETVTVGAGGTGVSAAQGNTGGTSSFGSHLQATGGVGGVASAVATTTAFLTAAAGGIGSLGDINAAGDAGMPGGRNFGSTSHGGGGGGSNMGGGGQGVTTAAGNNGNAGQAYGGGGSGAANAVSQSARAGAAGAAGVVIVWEYVEV